MGRPWRVLEDGLELRVRVTPRASRAALAGVVRDAEGKPWLALKVTAPPEQGEANAAALRFLAKMLGLPPSALAVVAGHAARWKRVRVSGQPDALAERVAAATGQT